MRIFQILDNTNFSHHYINFGGKSLNELFETILKENSIHFTLCSDFLNECDIEIQKIKFSLEKETNKTKIYVNYEKNIFLIFYFNKILTSFPDLNINKINCFYKPKLVFWYDFINFVKKKENIYINNILDVSITDWRQHFQPFPELIYVLCQVYINREQIYYYENGFYKNIYECFPFIVDNKNDIGYINIPDNIDINKYINDAITENRVRKYYIPEDGSCLFHSLARHLSDTSEKKLRKQIVNYERKYMKELIAPFLEIKFEEYLDEMMKPTTFGGEPEIIAFSNLYKLRVVIYDIERTNTLFYGDYNKTIFLLFHKTSEHYEILDINEI